MRDSGYLNSGQEQLYYVTHLPGNLGESKVGVIFVHASGGNRFGPHRMFVEFSEKLSDKYICIRFDLTGCGDSSGVCQGDTKSHQEDIISAVHYFRNLYRLEHVYLVGISRGSHLICQILSENDLHVTGAVLLSCPVASHKAALRTFSARLKGYLLKLFDIKSLKKVISGQVNIEYVFRSLASALSLKQRYSMESISNKSLKNNCPRLFIYGQNDPICAASMEFYRRICQQYNIAWKSHVISFANHSFFHYVWKEEIYTIISEWLDCHHRDSITPGKAKSNAAIAE